MAKCRYVIELSSYSSLASSSDNRGFLIDLSKRLPYTVAVLRYSCCSLDIMAVTGPALCRYLPGRVQYIIAQSRSQNPSGEKFKHVADCMSYSGLGKHNRTCLSFWGLGQYSLRSVHATYARIEWRMEMDRDSTSPRMHGW